MTLWCVTWQYGREPMKSYAEQSSHSFSRGRKSQEESQEGSCDLVTVPTRAMPWLIRKTVYCNLFILLPSLPKLFASYFCMRKQLGVRRLLCSLLLSSLLKRRDLEAPKSVIWMRPGGARMLYWVRTRSLHHAGLSHRREMQVAIISRVQNWITKSLEAVVVQHLLGPWERLLNKWKWV